MKKILFVTILALSINASAQSQFLLYSKHHPVFNSLENAYGRMEENGLINLRDLNGRNILPTLKHQASDPGTLIQVVDSIYRWNWDDLTLGWKGYDKTIEMVYNNKNSIESQVHCWMYTDTTWYYDSKRIYTFDAFNNQTSELLQLWHGTYHYWYDFERHSYTYDVQNNRVLTLWQISNTNGDEWENTIQLIYNYDFTNNNTKELHQTWTGTEWANDYLVTKTYNNDNIVISIVDQSWNEGAFENYARWDYAYDSNSNEISELIQGYHYGVWGNNLLYTSVYDSNNNRTSYLTQHWDSGTWVDFSRITSEYDNNNNLISEFGENWDGNTWINSFQRTYTYDGNNFFLKSRSNKNWNIAGTAIQSGDSTYNYFHTFTGINENKDQTEKVIVYPNPGKGVFMIISSNKINAIEVYDILGKEIYFDNNVKQQKSMEIDLSGCGEGIYFVKINTGGISQTEKIIIN